MLRHLSRFRRVALVLVLLACVGSAIALGTRTPKAEAAVDQVFPSTTTFSAGFGLYGSNSDHIFIVNNHAAADAYSATLYGYCLNMGKSGPWDDTWTFRGVYRNSFWATCYGMIMTNGWPNTNTIFNVTYSNEDAAGITQDAVWCCTKAMEANNKDYRPSGISDRGYDLYHTMANYLTEHPDLITNSSELCNNICAWYQSPNSNKQDVLVVTTKPYGYITVDKSAGSSLTVTGAMGTPFYGSMEGAEYTLYTTRECTTPVKTIANTDAVYVIDGNGHSISHRFPPGRYYLKETKAPTGYKLDPTVIGINAVSTETHHESVTDEPIVGYIKVIKKDASSGETVAQAGFEFDLYQKDGTTPLAHGVTGDDGTVTFDANLALGEYEVLETAVPSGTNWTVNTTRQPVTLTQSGSSGAITGASSAHENGGPNNVVHVEISDDRSTASVVTDLVTSSNGKRIILTNANNISTVNLTDKVVYQGLNPDKSYFLVGELRRKSDESLLGSQVTSNALTPAASGSGTFTMTLPLNLSDITASDTVVAYEELHVDSADGDIVGSHKDINDSRQSITFRTPSIGTSFATANGGKSITHAQTGNVNLVDTVTYSNLDTSKTYTLSGSVYKTNGTSLTSTTPISTNTKSFQPSSTNGNTTLTFSINMADVDSAKIVAYEELKEGDVVIAEHKVPSDTSQTITITDEPTIGTTLATASNGKTILDDNSTVTLKDTVHYSGLTPGHTYKLVGELRINDDTLNGVKVTGSDGEKTFTADGSANDVTVDLPLDLSLVNGAPVVAFEELYDGSTKIAEHKVITDSNQTVTLTSPSIGTTLATASGGKTFIDDNSTITLTDTIAYENLVSGRTYQIRGELRIKDGTMNGVLLEGSTITPFEFQATAASGTVDVSMSADLSKVDNKPLVAFEELWYDGEKIAEHKSISDSNQTVTPITPSIGTTLATADGLKELIPTSGTITLKDTVSYSNLIPGQQYELRGELRLKDGTAEGTRIGNVVTVTFNPESASGTTVVDLPLSLAGLENDVVAFEELYLNGTLIASHKEIGDSNQTVSVKHPSIGTTLATADGGKEIVAAPSGTITLRDKVDYRNLVPNKEYRLHGVIHKKDGSTDGGTIGNAVDYPFTPETASGSVYVEFTLNLADITTPEIVAFEQLYLGTDVIASHEVLGDSEQTIVVRTPTLGTSFATTDGEKEAFILGQGTITLRDTVTYGNLVPNQQYTVSGTIHGRDGGTDKGALQGVTNSKTFIPTSASGTVTIEFTFDMSKVTTPEIVAFEQLILNDAVVASHEVITDANQTIKMRTPEIGTKLSTEDGRPGFFTTGETTLTLVDTVTYHDLIPGKEYEMRASMHAKDGTTDKGEVEGATATKKFTPSSPNGTVDVTITVDLSKFDGTGLVAFEKLYLGANLIASHEDIGDGNQTVLPHSPRIGTKLANIDGATAIHNTGKIIRVVDTVEYEDLIPGREYVLSGAIHARGDGKDDGVIDGATATKTFTPERASGTTQIEFEVDLSKIDGDAMVAFEELWYGESKIAEHAEIGDEGQTITMLSPSIGTTLATIDGDKETLIGIEAKTVSLVDTVTYHNLIVGQEYILKGELHAKGEDGSDVGPIEGSAGEIVFTPETQDGTVNVTLTLNFANLTTNGAVAFEELYLKDELVAVHRNIEDKDQTIQTRKPSIGTTLMTADGKKVISAGSKEKIQLVDTVEYHDLVPGKEYEICGEIHARNENGTDAGAIAGTQGSTKFTPETPDGKTTVTMTIDLTNVTKTLVAFEELRVSVSDGNGGQQSIKLAEHKEIGDDAQSVRLMQVASKANDKVSGKANDLIQTGDIIGILGIWAATLGGCGWAAARHQKKVA